MMKKPKKAVNKELENTVNMVKKIGYRITRNPDTVYVLAGTQEYNLPVELIQLRDKYGFMIQTEIV